MAGRTPKRRPKLIPTPPPDPISAEAWKAEPRYYAPGESVSGGSRKIPIRYDE